MSAGTPQKPTILVVEDNVINRELLLEYLSGPYNVLWAANGLDALELIESNLRTIKLVLLDIVMPGFNGFDVLEEMNSQGWIEYIPVVIVSSEGAETVRNEAYLHNVVDYIVKPFSPEEVLACVRRILL
ncbi:MAG: response regulator [Clostridia bacterium]|nr:response regulator [Clostridia bacterium]